jgi:molybdopterin-containing oxidoreductase family iron-sulfur binding subunit
MQMPRYGMVIELKTCIGCNACTISCKAKNVTPPGVFWCRVLEKEIGRYPTASRIFLPVLCNHCELPACQDVCPTGATYTREDGIVLVDGNKCIACGACIEACPYEARSFMNEKTYFSEITSFEKNGYQKFHKGTVVKCNLCIDRIEEGLEPECVEVCPVQCRHFGDLEDPDNKASKLLIKERGFQLLPDKGTDPCVYYID